MSVPEPLLQVADLHVYHDQLHALNGIGFVVRAGDIVTLIGANGAGKSSTLNAISGLLPVRQGTIRMAGEDIANTPAHRIARNGIVQVPEGRRIFRRLTVLENINLGAYGHDDRAGIAADRERVLDLFPRLRERLTQIAGTLSGGEQQMLAMARALMARPRILLMDEPSMGLAPMLVDQVFDTIQDINRQGMTILLVEQNAYMALEIAHYAYVIASGAISSEGTGAELLRDPAVTAAYLGEG